MESWNNLELRMTLAGVLPNSEEEEEEWIKNTWELRKSGKAYIFAMTDYNENWLGTIGLHNVSHKHQTCELGIAIHKPGNRGKGYGTDGLITICGLAFLYLNLHRVELEYLPMNEGGARAYEKAVFTQTGRKRKVLYRKGKFHDLHQMDILRDEWIEKFGDEYDLLPSDTI